jgi:hypothetical protein
MIALAHVTCGGITRLDCDSAPDNASLNVDVEFTLIADVHPGPVVRCEADYKAPQSLTANYPMSKRKAVFDAFRIGDSGQPYCDLRDATFLVDWSDSVGYWELVSRSDRRIDKPLNDYQIRKLVDEYYEQLSMAD